MLHKLVLADSNPTPGQLELRRSLALGAAAAGTSAVNYGTVQAWRTEAWALVQVAPTVRAQQGHGQELGMFGLPLPRNGPFIIGSALDQVPPQLGQTRTSTPASGGQALLSP